MPGNDFVHIQNFNLTCRTRLDQADAEKRSFDRNLCQIQQKIISEFQHRLDNVVQLFIIRKSNKTTENAQKDLPPELCKDFECIVCKEMMVHYGSYIFQCFEGHLICEDCRTNQGLKNQCPECRESYDNKMIRSLIAEKSVKLIELFLTRKSSEGAENTMKVLPPEVREDFECVVCFQLMSQNGLHIFQCCHGHLICQTCRKNPHLKNCCPSCRMSYDNKMIRSRIAEKVVQRFSKE